MAKLFYFSGDRKRFLYFTFTLLVSWSIIFSASAQENITIRGKVIDGRNNEPIIGASVVTKSFKVNSGTATDVNGEFDLKVASLPTSIIVSYIGYRSEEINIYERSVGRITISLSENSNSLDEVVVVGYGTQKKISVTNSVSQITGDELNSRPVSNIQQSLQGKLPGVTVLDLGGIPGRSTSVIRVRGITTFNTASQVQGETGRNTSGFDLSKNAALVIVDGIEQEWNYINPDDIESVSILKDASSTAIYGSRGTNGVILVTTKGAKSGKTQVDINSYVGWQNANNRPEPMGLEAYMKEQQIAYANTNRFPEKFTDESIRTWVNATDRDKYPLPNTWFQTLLHSAPQYSTSVAISGGNDIVRSRLSLRYFNQEGVIDNFGSNLTEGKLSTEFTVSPSIKVNAILDYRNDNSHYPTALSQDNPLNNFFHGSLWAAHKYEDGTYGLSTQGNNPLLFIEKGGLSHIKNDYLSGNIKTDWEIIKGLTFTNQFGMIYSTVYQKNYTNAYTNTDKNTNITKTVANNNLTEVRNNVREYTWNNLLIYRKAIEKHDFSALAGYSQTSNTKTFLSAYRERFYNNDIASISQGANDATKSNSGNDEEFGLLSYFGRINYGYDRKYLLEINGRYDGSSKFTGDKQYGFFPSFSAGWVISEEEFWTPLRRIVNNLKLRGSYGKTGNQSVGLYSYYASLVSSGYNFGGTAVSGYRQTTLANTELGWESTTQADLGLTTTLYNKLELTIDYYKKTTNNILLKLDIPAVVGLEASPQNAGSVENKGLEFSLNFKNKMSFGLGYEIGGNFNINKNKVTDLKGTGPYFVGDAGINPRYAIAENLPINTLWGYKTDGLFQSIEEIETYRGGAGRHPFNQLNPQPGDVKYLDLSGNGSIDADDMVALGNSFPTYTFGFNLGCSYKNFELSALFQGTADVDVRLSGALAEMGNQEGFTHKIYENNYWTPENRNARFPRPVKSDLTNVASSDRLIVDASYIRLKDLQVAYNIPVKSLWNSSVLKKARIFVSATNLFTISKLNEWNLDPEVESGRAVYYPQTSLYSISIRLQF
ncbi:TonB-dependent receptor SusC [termite gut metagenome]|uniref:TonB-dependent receptor SusC n=1 Tax=termite gut metagenome TaxID=433724 RepID=A0A5J4SQR7_9ZZZZ